MPLWGAEGREPVAGFIAKPVIPAKACHVGGGAPLSLLPSNKLIFFMSDTSKS